MIRAYIQFTIQLKLVCNNNNNAAVLMVMVFAQINPFCTKNRMFESHSIFKQFLAIFISFVVISVTKMRRKLTSLGTCCFFSHVNRKYKNHIELNFFTLGSQKWRGMSFCNVKNTFLSARSMSASQFCFLLFSAKSSLMLQINMI